ncbi:RNA polymerase sigma-70 factor [Marinilabiliaceae bacterium JC017]|nr:RNA polymerase sigma-70 factor [Marinilabiliaceae bacterium JC017]
MGPKLDENKILQLKNGSVAAFEAIFHEYADRVYAFAFSILKNESDSKEVVQETFFKIWLNHEKLKVELSFESYLFTIARNITISNLRSKKNTSSIEHEDILVTTNVTEDEILFHDVKGQLDDIIDQLSPRKREIFLLSRVDGLSHEEIASKLGLSVQTVHNHVSGALSFIKEHLQNDLMTVVFILLFSHL